MKYVALLLLLTQVLTANADTFADSIFFKVAKTKKVDPLLLYAVSYLCSANQDARTSSAPNPFMLLVDGKKVAANNLVVANKNLKQARYTTDNVSIGLMCISLKYYPREYPDDLFDPQINLELGADILKDLQFKHKDPVLAVGKYFAPQDEKLALNYGQRIWAIRNNIETYFKPWELI